MKPIFPVKMQPRFVTFRAAGKAGRIVHVERTDFYTLRDGELFAVDSSPRPGHGTRIVRAVNGATVMLVDIPTWFFSEWIPPLDKTPIEKLASLCGTDLYSPEVHAAWTRLKIATIAGKMKLKMDVAVPFSFDIHFDVDCVWDGVIFGNILA